MNPLRKILFICLASMLLLIFASFVFDRGYRNFWKPFYDKTDVAFLGKTNYEVLFFGNSTVHFGINPYYVDSVSKLSSYNLGIGGANITVMNALLMGYLENHLPPKIIFYSMNYSTFGKADNSNYFLFFDYLENKYAATYLRQKKVNVGLIKVFPFLKWSYFDDYNRANIIAGFAGSPFIKNAIIYNGFINNTNDSIRKFDFNTVMMASGSQIEEQNVALLNDIISTCKKKRIKLVFLFAPEIKDASDFTQENLRVDSFINKTSIVNNIRYKRFDDSTFFPLYQFHDKWHLNKSGTELYSIMLGSFVNEILKEK
ncbi:MAG: hypothetical protein ABIY51_09275 [Ferruginibacter sp.]